MNMKKYTIYDFENRTTRFMNPVTIFISQPFTGYEIDEVKDIRNRAKEKIKEKYKDDSYIRFIDNLDCYFCDDPLEGLSKAILYLSVADAAYFVKLWDINKNEYRHMSRGCRIEYAICKEYNISTSEIHVEV